MSETVLPQATDAAVDATPQRIAFVGPPESGRTTIATLVADRLDERTDVAVTGEAAAFFEAPNRRPRSDALGFEWTVVDAPPGTNALAERSGELDATFVVVTPDDLEAVEAYRKLAERTDTDVFVVVNRFTEADRERLRAFEGPELAEYFYEDETIRAAMANGGVPLLEEWTVEALLIESLQPERLAPDAAVEALEAGRRSVVNVEVADRADADSLIERFEAAGYRAAYFECNCRCHDGHVLATAEVRSNGRRMD